MAEPVTIKLRKPITYGSRVIDQLTIRPIKAKDLRRVGGDDSLLKASLNMASWLSGEVSEVIDELEGEDLAEVLGVVERFFGAVQATGASASRP